MPVQTVLHSELTLADRQRRRDELARVEERVRFAGASRGERSLAFVFVRPGEISELLECASWDNELRAGEQAEVRVFECSGCPPFATPRQLVSTWLARDLVNEERPPQVVRPSALPQLKPQASDWGEVRAWLAAELDKCGVRLGPRQRLSPLAT